MNMDNVWKFNPEVDGVVSDDHKGDRAFALRERLNRGEKLSREDKNYLTRCVLDSSFFCDSIAKYGYRIYLGDVMKRYWVKQYGAISEYHAFDKTSLRQSIYGRIQKIVEVK